MTRTHITKSCDDCGLELATDRVYKNSTTEYWLQVHGTGRNEFRDRNSKPLDFCCAACMINYYERNELVTTPAFTALDKLITALEQLGVPSILAHPDMVSAKEVIEKAGKRVNVEHKNNKDSGIDFSKHIREYLEGIHYPRPAAPNTYGWPSITTTDTKPYYPGTYISNTTTAADMEARLNDFLKSTKSPH